MQSSISMPNMGTVALLGDVTVVASDMETLSKRQSWVNDIIIHIHGRMIEKDANKENPNTVLFVAPCTVQYIRFNEAKEDTRLCIQQMNFQQYEMVLLPITNGTSYTSRGNHWSLIIYLPQTNTFLHCDSMMGHGNSGTAISLVTRLEELLNIQNQGIREPTLPQQHNSHDCGVFIMAYAEFYVKNRNFENISSEINQNKMRRMRKELADRIRQVGFVH